MSFLKLASITVILLLSAVAVPAQDRSTGIIKGKVRVEKGSSPSGVTVTVKAGDRQVAVVETDSKGSFTMAGIAPGVYSLTFRKSGLSVGSLSDITVQAGKTRDLGDRLYMSVDEGSIAFLRGSVFDPNGRSVPGIRVELFRIEEGGATKKLDNRVTTETGQFVFRLTPNAAKYRVTAKADGIDPISKDVEIDGAAIYRIALSLPPPAK